MTSCPFCPGGACPDGAVHLMNDRDTERIVTVTVGTRVHAVAIHAKPGLDYSGAVLAVSGLDVQPRKR